MSTPHTPDNFTLATGKDTQTSIGRDAAIELYQSGWWEGRTAKEVAGFQLSTEELCLPFDVFHGALEGALGRPVWTHELGLNIEGIFNEFHGKAGKPTMEDIINQIPESKRVIVETEGRE